MHRLVKKGLSLFVVLSLLVTLISGFTVLADPADIIVPVVHIADTHGYLYNEKNGNINDYRMAYLSKEFDKIKADNGGGDMIRISGGDMFQGTPASNMLVGKPIVKAMVAMQFDAMALGNHEFDWGLDSIIGTNQNLKDSTIPVLACNVFSKSTGKLNPYVKTHVIVEKQGKKIALIGVAGSYKNAIYPAFTSDLDIRQAAPIVEALAEQLITGGEADAAIVVTHMGWGELEGMCNALDSTYVKAVFGGHDNQYKADTVNGVARLGGGYGAQGYSTVNLVFKGDGSVTAENPKMVSTSSASANATPDKLDAAIVAISDKSKLDVAPIMAQVIGRTDADITRSGTGISGTTESLLGNLACDALRKVSGADFAVYQGGGLRADIPAGDITVGSMYASFPFDNNTLCTVKMTGAQFWGIAKRLHTSGLTFDYDATKPAGEQYTNIRCADGSLLDMNKLYTVATNSFLGTGGDGYTVFAEAAVAATFFDYMEPTRDTITNYIKSFTGALPIHAGDKYGVVVGEVQFEEEIKEGYYSSILANLTTDAMKEQSGADVALISAALLKGTLYSGTVSDATLARVLGNDTIYTVSLSGKQLKALLEASVGEALKADGEPLYFAGISIVYDAEKPAGSRLMEVKLADGRTFEDNQLYTVALNSTLFTAPSASYAVLKEQSVTDSAVEMKEIAVARGGGDPITVRKAVSDYVAANSPLILKADVRITAVEHEQPEAPSTGDVSVVPLFVLLLAGSGTVLVTRRKRS